MRIGIMLRHLQQHGGGVLVYTKKLLRQLVAQSGEHELILMYANGSSIGSYGNGDGIREVVLRSPTVVFWDQVAVPLAARRERVDIVFNPKYSIPLATRSRTVFVCHGLDWFVRPEWSRWRDRLNHRLLFPRYVRAADHIIAVSETTKRHLMEFLGVDEHKVTTIYHGVDECFRKDVRPDEVERVVETYNLPERFYLFCGQIYPPKNFGRLVRAFAKVARLDHRISLVVAGTHTWLCEDEIASIDRLGLADRVMRLGWVPRQDLPPLYAAAEALVMPSLYESFGLPLLEAMSVGCPVLTSDRGGTREIVGEAGLLVSPTDVDQIADGMRRIVEDEALRNELIAAGLKRAGQFSWEKCAHQTLHVLERLGKADAT